MKQHNNANIMVMIDILFYEYQVNQDKFNYAEEDEEIKT